MSKIYPLKGKIQNYAWGGKNYIPDLLGIDSQDQKYAGVTNRKTYSREETNNGECWKCDPMRGSLRTWARREGSEQKDRSCEDGCKYQITANRSRKAPQLQN